MSRQPVSSLPSRWADVPAALPSALADLHGPVDGRVELPADLVWSGRRVFDLADETGRYLYYVTVLTCGVNREHYTAWLNADLLLELWPRLRLPRALRRIWQDRFPELEAAAVARSA